MLRLLNFCFMMQRQFNDFELGAYKFFFFIFFISILGKGLI